MKSSSAGPIHWIESELLPRLGARAAFPARTGGASRGDFESLNLGLHVGDDEKAVIENRRRFWGALDLDPDSPVGVRQVHGAKVITANTADRGRGARSWAQALAEADGLITAQRGLPLFTLGADCILVALAAPEGRGCAALHAGWRGLAGGVIEAGARGLAELAGCEPEDLAAFASVGLGEANFEVQKDFVQQLAEAWSPEAAERFVKREGGRLLFRYGPALKARLDSAGLRPENIEVAGGCTAESPEVYYSHRASGGRTGRMALTVWMP